MKKLTATEIVLKSYDDIYKSAKKVAEAFAIQTLPLNTLKAILDKVQFKDVEDENVFEFVNVYRNTLNVLYSTCETTAKNVNSTHIPLSYLKACIDTLKESFIEGFKTN